MNNIQKSELVFVRILIPLILGIITGILLPCTVLVYQVTLMLSLSMLLALWLSIIYYQKLKLYFERWKPGLFMHLLVFLTAICLTLYSSEKLNTDHFSRFQNEALVVSVTSEPKLNGDILRFEACVKQGLIGNVFRPESGRLLVALKLNDSSSIYNYGDELLVRSDFTEVDPPFNPYEFNFKSYLANHFIYHQAFINETQIRVLNHQKGNLIISCALGLRKRMVHKYETYIHNQEAASVASTLILGYKADLSREVLAAYSKTGTMHVLSVSGMHVGIVFAVLTWMLGFMNRTKRLRLIRAIIIILLIWFYALITGFSPSVSRAALMLSIYVLGKAVNRRTNSYNLVSASAVLLLIYNPYFLFDAGCQLSYLAVLGLIYFYPKIYHLLYIQNWLGDKVWSYVALSCAAQLATFPLGLYYFHQFPVYFLISNLFIVLPVVLIMYLGIAFLFIPWDIVLKPLGWMLENSIVYMDKGLFYIEHLPFANIQSYNSNFIYYLLIYMVIGAFMLSYQNKSKKMWYSALLFFLVFVIYRSYFTIKLSQQNKIVFYSLRKHSGIAFFNGAEADLYSDLDSADKTMAFSVTPSLCAWSDRINYHKYPQSGNMVFADRNFFQFKNWKMLVCDKDFIRNNYYGQMKVNALLLSENPRIKLEDLLKNIKFDMLLIDGKNSDYSIRKWKQEATELSVKTYVLKKNPAYSVNLD